MNTIANVNSHFIPAAQVDSKTVCPICGNIPWKALLHSDIKMRKNQPTALVGICCAKCVAEMQEKRGAASRVKEVLHGLLLFQAAVDKKAPQKELKEFYMGKETSWPLSAMKALTAIAEGKARADEVETQDKGKRVFVYWVDGGRPFRLSINN